MNPDAQEVLASLDELLAQTPVERLPALLAALHARHGAALTRLEATTWATPDPTRKPVDDENLSAKATAQRLGVSESWVYRNARNLPFTRRIGRRVLFSSRGLEKWNRQRRGNL